MTREKFNRLCRECCTQKSTAECLFADAEVGFIDTSAGGDGSRGIAFSNRKMMVNFNGTVKNVAYCKIRSVRIISSLENAFADELEISGEHSRLRITDYSLDKHKLKEIIEGLREGIEKPAVRRIYVKSAMPPAPEETKHEEAAPPAPEETKREEAAPPAPEEMKREEAAPPAPEEIKREEAAPTVLEQKIRWLSDMDEEYVAPKPAARLTPSKEEIEWLNAGVRSGKKAAPEDPPAENKVREETVFEQKIEWLSEMSDEDTPPVIPEVADKEAEEREFLEQMSHEETIDYLTRTLSEINSEAPVAPETADELPMHEISPVGETEPPAEKKEALTKEPLWGDIYIKASRSLRELCESGRLSMEVMERELRERLLSSANAFSEITADEQSVPKVLVPRITELKNAAEHFDEYFGYGEDIGVRVMFFMHYQMLSYADRIAENPDTKERLNDFFRRFGTAGITLSMLDVRA